MLMAAPQGESFYDWMMRILQLVKLFNVATEGMGKEQLMDDPEADKAVGDVWDELCARKAPFDWLMLAYLLCGGIDPDDGIDMLQAQGPDEINMAAEATAAAFMEATLKPKNSGPGIDDIAKLWQP